MGSSASQAKLTLTMGSGYGGFLASQASTTCRFVPRYRFWFRKLLNAICHVLYVDPPDESGYGGLLVTHQSINSTLPRSNHSVLKLAVRPLFHSVYAGVCAYIN